MGKKIETTTAPGGVNPPAETGATPPVNGDAAGNLPPTGEGAAGSELSGSEGTETGTPGVPPVIPPVVPEVQQPPVASAPVSTVKVFETTRMVMHDSEEYAAGAEIVLDKKHADPLLAVGAIKEKAE